MIIKYKNSIIYFEDFKYAINNDLKKFIDNNYFKNIIDTLGLDLILVLGGDGTMLSAISTYKDLGIPFLGINFGNKGFLLNSKIPTDLKFLIKKYPIFSLETYNNTFYAFNEFDIRSSNGTILTLDISIGGCKNISISGDGIIISSPFGSTGYNSSLGGPIIPHDLDAYVLTPKAPWNPKGQQPILLKDNIILEISNAGRKNDFIVYSDGKVIDFKVEKFLIKKSNLDINMIVFTELLNEWENKIYYEQGFKRKRPA